MTDDNKPKIAFAAKIPLYVRVGWGMVILFAMVGNFIGKREAAVHIVVVAAAMWVALRILSEAQEALAILKEIRVAEKGDVPKS